MAKIFKFIYISVFFLTSFSNVVMAKESVKENLVIGMTQFPSTLHPSIDSMLAKTYIMAMTQRPFTLYDKDWKLDCMLCEELPSLEKGTAVIETHIDGTKGIAATYKIKEKAMWGDGVPVTTKDVLFAWQMGKHPLSGVSNFELYAKDIIDITVIDDKSFTLHFDKVTCDYQGIDDFNVLPAHLEKEVFEKDPKTYKDRTLYNRDITNAGLYFGPYKIVNVVSGVSLTLEKNPHWWGKDPYFKKITIRIIENTAALSANLLSGEVDYIAGELGLMIEQALSLEKRLKRQKPNQYDVIYKSGLIYEHIDINHDNPILSDVNVRQALLYAIDRESISKYLFEGKQPVAQSSVNPLDKVYVSDVKQYPYNPQKAAELLEKSGWSKRTDGFYYNKDGKKLIIQQITTAGNKSRELVQQAIQSNWKTVGIDSYIENQTPRVLFGQTTRERKFKDTTMYAWMSAPENIPRTTLYSDMVPSAKNNYAGQNYLGYKNSEMDKILDDLETTCGKKERQQLWYDLQKHYTEKLPALPLYYRADSFIIPKWLTGIHPTGHQYPTSFWVEHWGQK